MLRQICFAIALVLSLSYASAQLPSVQLRDIEGKRIATDSLSDGKHPLIITFFATWCKPCLRELSAIDEVYPDWQAETGVRLVAVSIDEGANSKKVKPLVRAKGWSYEVLLDPNGEFKRAMSVQVIPSVIVLGAEGEVIYRHTGYTEGGEQKIIEALRQHKR
ncbi:MAG: TlpA disulfide reductase family protein [Porphyromonas sp.]|nr:TlpA disulfide reductase family protein [Porphyromonas sp.]